MVDGPLPEELGHQWRKLLVPAVRRQPWAQRSTAAAVMDPDTIFIIARCEWASSVLKHAISSSEGRATSAGAAR